MLADETPDWVTEIIASHENPARKASVWTNETLPNTGTLLRAQMLRKFRFSFLTEHYLDYILQSCKSWKSKLWFSWCQLRYYIISRFKKWKHLKRHKLFITIFKNNYFRVFCQQSKEHKKLQKTRWSLSLTAWYKKKRDYKEVILMVCYWHLKSSLTK